MARMIRVLVYEGPQYWLDMIKDKDFVKGTKVLGADKSITELIREDWVDAPVPMGEQKGDV